jgi:hypothetical protein
MTDIGMSSEKDESQKYLISPYSSLWPSATRRAPFAKYQCGSDLTVQQLRLDGLLRPLPLISLARGLYTNIVMTYSLTIY